MVVDIGCQLFLICLFGVCWWFFFVGVFDLFVELLLVELEIGDIVFICVIVWLFFEVVSVMCLWMNYVGIVVGECGGEMLIVESMFLLLCVMMMLWFFVCFDCGVCVIVWFRQLFDVVQCCEFVVVVMCWIGVVYDMGFNFVLCWQFCLCFVCEVVCEVMWIVFGDVEIFDMLLYWNFDYLFGFWRIWYFGWILWYCCMVMLVSIFDSGVLCVVMDMCDLGIGCDD